MHAKVGKNNPVTGMDRRLVVFFTIFNYLQRKREWR